MTTGTGTGIWAMERKWLDFSLFLLSGTYPRACLEPRDMRSGVDLVRAVTPVSPVVFTSALLSSPSWRRLALCHRLHVERQACVGEDVVVDMSRVAAGMVSGHCRKRRMNRANETSRRQVPKHHDNRHRPLPHPTHVRPRKRPLLRRRL